MPYSDASIPLNQLLQPSIDGEPLPAFTSTAFVGMVDGLRMAKNGAAILTITVEPDYVSQVFPLWNANTIVSVHVAPWEPYLDEDVEWDDVG